MSDVYPPSPLDSPPPDRPFRDRVGGQPAVRLGGAAGDRDLLREERDTLASRGQFLKEQIERRDAEIRSLRGQLARADADHQEVTERLTAERDEARKGRNEALDRLISQPQSLKDAIRAYGEARRELEQARAEAARLRDLLNEASIADPAPGCAEPHPPTHRCFDCATDDELAAAIPPFPGTEKG